MSFTFQDGLLPTFAWVPERGFCPQSSFIYLQLLTMLCSCDVDLWPQDHFPNQNSLTITSKIWVKRSIFKPKLKESWGGGSWSGVSGHAAWFWLQPIEELGGSRGERGGRHCQGGIVLTMFQVRHCRALLQPQQLQERHCDDRGDVGSDDIVIKWSEQKKETNIIIRAGEVAAALVFEENVIVDLIASNFPLSPSEASKR